MSVTGTQIINTSQRGAIDLAAGKDLALTTVITGKALTLVVSAANYHND